MTRLPLLLITLLLCSCSTATIKTVTEDGRLCEATYASVMKETDTTSLSACGAKGGTTGSKVNTALFEAFMQVMAGK
jgi:hypothetical protein